MAIPTLILAGYRYGKNLVITPGDSTVTVASILAFLRNIDRLGYTVTPDALKAIQTMNAGEFNTWATHTIDTLKSARGDNWDYKPMYPNFPQQVAEASDAELFTNALVHYFSVAYMKEAFLPLYTEDERPPLNEDVNVVVLGHVLADDAATSIVSNLMNAKISFAEADATILEELLSEMSENAIKSVIPATAVNKENFAVYANFIINVHPALTDDIVRSTNNPNDLLRILAVATGNHPSLTEKVKFKNVARPIRRAILTGINRLAEIRDANSVAADMKTNRVLWKQAARIVHPFEKLNQNILAQHVFALIANKGNIRTLDTAVQEAFNNGDVIQAAKLLSSNPGQLARSLNSLLAAAATDEQNDIVNIWAEQAENVSTTVLWQVYSFFQTAQDTPEQVNSMQYTRGVNGAATLFARRNTVTDTALTGRILLITYNAIIKQYAALPPLTNVQLVQDGTAKPTIPFGMRSSSNKFGVVGRGSRFAIDKDKTARLFVFWRNLKGGDWDSRVDIDLSASYLTEDFAELGYISFYNLRDGVGIHSGDITNAPNGAVEYIDLNLPKLRAEKPNARYVLMSLNNYTRQKFSDLAAGSEIAAGFMERKHVDDGEVFEPSTVNTAFTVTSSATVNTPLLLDIITGEVIWLDLSMVGAAWQANTLHSTESSRREFLKVLTNKCHITMNDVVKAHLIAREQTDNDTENTSIEITSNRISIPMDDFISNWV